MADQVTRIVVGPDESVNRIVLDMFDKYNGKVPIDVLRNKLVELFKHDPIHEITQRQFSKIEYSPLKIYTVRDGIVYNS